MIRHIALTVVLLVLAIIVGLVLAVPSASQVPVSPPTDPGQITPEIIPISTVVTVTPLPPCGEGQPGPCFGPLPTPTPAYTPTPDVPVSPVEQPTPTLKKPTLGDDPAPWVWSEGEGNDENPDSGAVRIFIKISQFNPWGLRGQ